LISIACLKCPISNNKNKISRERTLFFERGKTKIKKENQTNKKERKKKEKGFSPCQFCFCFFDFSITDLKSKYFPKKKEKGSFNPA